MPKQILVVDDDPDTRTLIWDILEDESYEVHLCASGEQALRLLGYGHFDLILADIKMPGISGMELLDRVQDLSPTTKVIIITAYASVETVKQAWHGQAFDYLTKPFDIGELRRQIEKALALVPMAGDCYLDLCIDRKARQVTRADQPLDLTCLEFDVLAYLFDYLGLPVSHEALLRYVWQRPDPVDHNTDTVKSLIARLRRRLGDDAKEPRYIFSVRGVGYRLGE